MRLPVKARPMPDHRLASGPAARRAARSTNWITAPKAKPHTTRPMKPLALDWKPSAQPQRARQSSAVTPGRMSVRRSAAPSVLRQASSGHTRDQRQHDHAQRLGHGVEGGGPDGAPHDERRHGTVTKATATANSVSSRFVT